MKKHTKEKTEGKVHFSWEAPDHPHGKKSKIWYIFAALAGGGLVFYGIQSESWIFSAAILLFAGTYALVHRHPPRHVHVKISEHGISFGRHHFEYHNLKNFWIVHEPPFVNKLYLRKHTKLHPDFYISLEDENPSEIHRFLVKKLREIPGRHEPFADIFARLFKF